jgi:hypothetical protein
MRKIITVLTLLVVALAIAVVFYIFKHDTAYVGKYTILYYKNQCDHLTPELLPPDLQSLMNIPCVIRITWQEQIADKMFQEYCYLPGKGIEKGRVYQKK